MHAFAIILIRTIPRSERKTFKLPLKFIKEILDFNNKVNSTLNSAFFLII